MSAVIVTKKFLILADILQMMTVKYKTLTWVSAMMSSKLWKRHPAFLRKPWFADVYRITKSRLILSSTA